MALCIKYLTPFGWIDQSGNLHKYIESVGDFEPYSEVKVKIYTQ